MVCPCGALCMLPFIAPVLASRYRGASPLVKSATLLAVPLVIAAAAFSFFPDLYASVCSSLGCAQMRSYAIGALALYLFVVKRLGYDSADEKIRVAKPCCNSAEKPAAAPAARAA